MNCPDFLSRLNGVVEQPEMLDHLRECDSCLQAAVHADADNLFKALGGTELTPPEGEDLFVASVMQQVAVRQAERTARPPSRYPAIYRWSIAAALATLLVSAGLRYGGVGAPPHRNVPTQQVASISTSPLVERPSLEDYDSAGATIVELPVSTSDMKIVMVFDESLPIDL